MGQTKKITIKQILLACPIFFGAFVERTTNQIGEALGLANLTILIMSDIF